MTQYGTWVSYAGSARIWLALGLLATAGLTAFTGSRLPLPARAARSGRAAVIATLGAWAASIVAVLVCATIYVERYIHVYHLALRHAAPPDNIFPVTLTAAGVVFIVIAVRSQGDAGMKLGSAAIGAMAGPMVFEFPFDLIVMARTYPPIPPDPVLYRALFFVPLFVAEITTLLLLRLSPMVQLTRATFFCFALMLTVFAVWALTGFGYPSAPVPYALNVVSKLLAFTTVLTLFLSPRTDASGDPAARGRAAAQ